MKIPITIEKNSAEDCPYTCPFRKVDYENGVGECRLFDELIKSTGYYDSSSYEACYPCQELFNNEQKEG